MKKFELSYEIPKRLSNEELNLLFRRLHAGDTLAREQLICHNMALVIHVVQRSFCAGKVDLDDLISIGSIGLIKAVTTFDCDKGHKFATYAARCIENEILMYFRSRKKVSREVSIYEPVGTDKEGNEINLLDIIEGDQRDFAEVVQLNEDTKKLDVLLDQVLEEREKEILLMRYGLRGNKELTQREIGDKLKISRSYISRIEKKSLQKLKMALRH